MRRMRDEKRRYTRRQRILTGWKENFFHVGSVITLLSLKDLNRFRREEKEENDFSFTRSCNSIRQEAGTTPVVFST